DGRDAPEEDGELVPPVEPALGAVELVPPEVKPAPAPLEQGPAAVEADRPAADRADEVPECAGERDGDVRAGVRGHARPEQVDVLTGEGPGRERASIDHDELAGC